MQEQEFAAPADVVDTSGLNLLTSRERQVASSLAIGLSNREIAKNLNISIKTVDTHRGHILKKLKLQGNVALARHAIRHAWVSL